MNIRTVTILGIFIVGVVGSAFTAPGAHGKAPVRPVARPVSLRPAPQSSSSTAASSRSSVRSPAFAYTNKSELLAELDKLIAKHPAQRALLEGIKKVFAQGTAGEMMLKLQLLQAFSKMPQALQNELMNKIGNDPAGHSHLIQLAKGK